MPDHVGNVSGRMIEGCDPNAWLVCSRNEGITGAQTCAHNSELVIALLLEPIEAAANVHHALAHRIERASDVGGYGVIRAADLGGHADIVIRHREPQH